VYHFTYQCQSSSPSSQREDSLAFWLQSCGLQEVQPAASSCPSLALAKHTEFNIRRAKQSFYRSNKTLFILSVNCSSNETSVDSTWFDFAGDDVFASQLGLVINCTEEWTSQLYKTVLANILSQAFWYILSNKIEKHHDFTTGPNDSQPTPPLTHKNIG